MELIKKYFSFVADYVHSPPTHRHTYMRTTHSSGPTPGVSSVSCELKAVSHALPTCRSEPLRLCLGVNTSPCLLLFSLPSPSPPPHSFCSHSILSIYSPPPLICHFILSVLPSLSASITSSLCPPLAVGFSEG